MINIVSINIELVFKNQFVSI